MGACICTDTRLGMAARDNDITAVKKFLSCHADPNKLKDAIKGGNIDIVRLLLDHGADPNWDDSEPLLEAIWCGKMEIVRLLSERGAIIDPFGYSSVHQAVICRDLEITKFLLGKGASPHQRPNLGCLLSRYNRRGVTLDLVRLLLEHDVNPNAQCHHQDGHTYPIHLAARHNATAIVRTLVAYGADINALDSENHTAHTVALWYNSKATVKFLQDRRCTQGVAEVLEHRAGGQVLRQKMYQLLIGTVMGPNSLTRLVHDPLFETSIMGEIWSVLTG